MTTVQDRTQEFRSCIASLSRLNSATVASSRQNLLNNTDNTTQKPTKGEFAREASVIAADIADTTKSLQRLALLAQRKTLFDDRPIEITELTHVIKQKVSKINSNIAALRTKLKNNSFKNPTNTNASAWGFNNKGESQINEHSNNVVVSLQEQLSNVTVGFSEVLEERTKNLQASRARTEQFISSAASSVSHDPYQLDTESPLYKSRQKGAGSLGDNPYAVNKDNLNPYNNENGQNSDDYLSLPDQSQSLALLEEQQDMYINERSNAVKAIESTIQELGGVFSQLAQMVAEQRETVQRIDANTEDISMNVSGAQRELLKYYSKISSNRWLMLKMFGIIVMFFFIWVLVS
ncbi:t-SNARE [Nadsonia fulvescens var. elongata DSM 6958]|uniref:t-SNARE n=1 Tax=Nadsonia fulvescens var. elongata DSM 6958 TaxID=857566 RepID=A0A1E3PQ16_9ASCO|nr:t-SNARE [Nadsonia fulvescens var. elongata DSM 6958]